MKIETPISFTRGKAGRKQIAVGAPALTAPPPDPVPRIARLMALAIHFDGLIRAGTVRDYADLARLGGVSRARITQIMGLLNLPPWEQERLLFPQKSPSGRDTMTERIIRHMQQEVLWNKHLAPAS
ncbi:hypothetical protein DB346_09745 [Verrucomicrobia bacterium LW23]|nr:hypothetical protein DB346_09745 [Verrucomicrobia bacterium LW23]